jgi:hypothetical protein
VTRTGIVVVWIATMCAGAAAQAQTPPAASPPAASEDIEPRVIGTTGTTTLGFGGFIDRFFSVENLFPTNYFLEVDVARFLTRDLAVTGGLTGMGSIGGEDSENLANGTGAPALHASGGLLYYFTPQSIGSLYAGGSYWVQLTQRGDRDAGTALGTLGFEGSLSSRVTLFAEGGYGIALLKGEHDERITRMLGRVGIRLKL